MNHDEEIKKLQEEAKKNRLAIANLSLLNAKKFSFLGWKACGKKDKTYGYFQLYKGKETIRLSSVFLEEEAKKKILRKEDMKFYKHFGETGEQFRGRMANAHRDIDEEEFEARIANYTVSCVECSEEMDGGPEEPEECPACRWSARY